MRVLEMTAHVQSISRGKGRSATAAAAYRACVAIEDEREGKTHDYTRKSGLEASAIVLPSGAPAWAADRAKLWNAAELRERNGARGKNAGAFKADAVTAREIMFSFPVELSPEGRARVAHAVARHLADTHGVAADFSIHTPGKEGDQRNHHCHLMMTTRRVGPDGFGEKTREWDGKFDRSRTVKAFRAFLADTLNAALAEEDKADLVHVEHRSFEERGGVGVKPTKHQGPGKTHAVRSKQRGARDAWHRVAQKAQAERHARERAALKTGHDFNLAAKTGDLAERERRGIAAIRADLARQQAADIAPTGLRRFFQIVSGGAMRADFDRQTRAAQRVEAADQTIADLKAAIRAERSAYAGDQVQEARALADRHRADDQHLAKSVTERVAFDRAAEVEMRREPAQAVRRERGQTREWDQGLSPS